MFRSEVSRWLDHRFGNGWSAEGLKNGASGRHYYRIHAPLGVTEVLCVYPSTGSDIRDVLTGSERLTYMDIQHAEVVAHQVGLPAVLHRDLGDVCLSDGAGGRYAVSLVESLRLLDGLQRYPVRPGDPRSHWNEDRLWQASMWASGQHELAGIVTSLLPKILLLETAWLHGDLHERNIMVSDLGVALIDFQDLGTGSFIIDWAAIVYDQNAARESQEIEEREQLAISASSMLQQLGQDALGLLRLAGVLWVSRIICHSRVLYRRGFGEIHAQDERNARLILEGMRLPEPLTRLRQVALDGTK